MVPLPVVDAVQQLRLDRDNLIRLRCRHRALTLYLSRSKSLAGKLAAVRLRIVSSGWAEPGLEQRALKLAGPVPASQIRSDERRRHSVSAIGAESTGDRFGGGWVGVVVGFVGVFECSMCPSALGQGGVWWVCV